MLVVSMGEPEGLDLGSSSPVSPKESLPAEKSRIPERVSAEARVAERSVMRYKFFALLRVITMFGKSTIH